jgi:RimJ/RimL family protein N-acetyltransferase
LNASIFTGQHVHLTAENPSVMGEAFSRWDRDSEFYRLLDNDPQALVSRKKFTDWLEKDLDREGIDEFFFSIRTIDEDQLIGFVALWDINWNQSSAWVSIGLGERNFWGRGYGTDAMRILLRYAFSELNLYRVSLFVFGYNERAIHSYQKAGYQVEGRFRQALLRSGKRWDVLLMGILRREWEASIEA